MPFNDGIPRTHSFSLTDFHDFDFCPFRFFVFHHLGKKYELAEGSVNLALGSLLDETIKQFHITKSYGQPPLYIKNLVKAARNKMLEKEARQTPPSFYSAIKPFLNDELCERASEVFINYYLTLDKKIKPSIDEVGFCEWIIKGDGGVFKLWGGPDALEMGDDGIPEIVDYKLRETLSFNSEEAQNYKLHANKNKNSLDMDLMPKIYTLLVVKKLKEMGFNKARFIVRLWLDPKNKDYYEEFDLDSVVNFEEIFKGRINKILTTQELKFCEREFCKACSSDQRMLFLKELKAKKLIIPDSIVYPNLIQID